MALPRADKADICLLLEGTFPYVSGGVSSWVNQIIRGFPEYTFACCFVGSRPEDYGDMKYTLPDNVVHLEVHYLHDFQRGAEKKPKKGDPKAFERLRRLHELMRTGRHSREREALLGEALDGLGDGCCYSEDAFLHSRASWDFISDAYRKYSRDPSFVDYFWTVRIMHSPLWVLNDIASNLIPARMYHTISTGYAGFLGAMLKRRTGKPLLLSEHGIYTKERKIDLFQSEWISDNRGLVEKNNAEMAYFREKWVNFFTELGRECYQSSNRIVALYERNRQRQVEDGAPAERTLNIPNGIDLPRMEKVRAARGTEIPQTACLIGRVVPIKDVKTFLRAMRTLVNEIPDAKGWIAGPEDEDKEYAAECRSLVTSLGLEKNVEFLGFQKIDELLPKVGVIVLSSISEALPLVLLEGFAAGVPAVSTDVGSCRQLIEGLDEEDRAFGKAGSVVGIADPEALGKAVATLLSDSQAWHDAQQAGIRRVETLYTQQQMFGSYRELYQGLLEGDI
ncbi:glycosyl transferase family 1 [Alcanivorax sp. HI0033]|uniref:GT4 family glycosyltransferase PelF n=1 Tax=unclassified Alcanivorax TaxID=2638842 RepID=UPI0007B7E2EB|nr:MULTISPECIES: GT4 family glycosyltransferase PelF [unclassified Alcanivorax]KZX75982.1 glycosyl transferase family 1 [Alcanivorax sp. HI0011]KZX80337.1 glycosyl transferase family 1 [Alcanivorax sp. HI0013]KZY12668.1 glycosyl transferase family 1 [Alcanivorax sp. HI0035]MEE2604193.1 GT4 family glycosyltransferase PelF [Pseudomonadota bacterium]KZX68986.1 glycosyl transferase family 1 [Alcanivorax sp. HI0007]